MEIKSRTQLVELMRDMGLPFIAVEVGTAECIFSSELLDLGIEKLYLVDLWESVPFIDGCASFEQSWHDKNYEEAKRKFGDKTNVILLKGFSYKMAEHIADESLGLVYIDADHSFHGTMADLRAYYPKLVKGGIMAMHDYGNESYGVYRAVQNFIQEKGLEVFELIENGDKNNLGAYFIKK